MLLHDAARPFVDQRIIADCVAALDRHEAAGVAVPTSDTIVVTDNGVMHSMPRRETLFRCQTPQCFRLPVIVRAHELAAADPGFSPTDDCGVVLRYLPGVQVHIVQGSGVTSRSPIRRTWPWRKRCSRGCRRPPPASCGGTLRRPVSLVR